VRCLALGWDRIRLVTHLDVTDEGVDYALEVFSAARDTCS
jgi:hypothetical protein